MVLCGLGRHLIKVFYKIKFQDFEFFAPILMLLFPFIDSIFYYSIQKFMKNKFYSPFFISFLIGCIHSIISIILICLFSLYNPEIERENLFYLLSTKINEVNIDKLQIPLLIIFSILFAYEFFAKIITLNSFSIFHYILLVYFGEVISSIFDLISNYDTLYMVIIIITFPIEIFGCLVLIETIELNFCGLNLNIKKNIIKRSINEMNSIYNINEEENEEEEDLTRILSNDFDDNDSRTNSVY